MHSECESDETTGMLTPCISRSVDVATCICVKAMQKHISRGRREVSFVKMAIRFAVTVAFVVAAVT